MYNEAHMNKRFFIIVIIIIGLGIIGGVAYTFFSDSPKLSSVNETPSPEVSATTSEPIPELPSTPHLSTPEPVKAIYMSSWIAGTSTHFNRILKFIEETEANAVVIDIKDATGRVSFLTEDPTVKATGSPENRIKNIKELLELLHSKNIYVIGRISTFQDAYLAKTKPDWALQKKSDGSVWKDKKGLPFLDPANPEVITYHIALGQASFDVGFDEINFDYIRYPSDGNVKDIDYKLKEGESRADKITQFAERIHTELKKTPGLVLSADVFGLTTTEKTDMGIGQVFERMFPYFDYVAPMIYPSHYANGEYGIKKPAEQPYETIMKALAGAKKKTELMATTYTQSASGTSIASVDQVQAEALYKKVRPWLQDFSIHGVTYDAQRVRAQIQATYDSGLTSWMMWDPSNKYTPGAYNAE